MLTNTIHQTPLAIPQGMNRLHTNQADAIQGGKRREGAFAWRAGYGVIGALLIGPFGFVAAFL